MGYSDRMPVGVIVARLTVDNPWVDHVWRTVELVPGAPQIDQPREVLRNDRQVSYHLATVDIEIFRKETEAYIANLNEQVPGAYVILRADPDASPVPYRVQLVTVSPWEAGSALDVGEDLVDRLAMSDAMIDWLEAFISEHHVEHAFYKRKRTPIRMEDEKFGQEPIFAQQKRIMTPGDDNDE